MTADVYFVCALLRRVKEKVFHFCFEVAVGFAYVNLIAACLIFLLGVTLFAFSAFVVSLLPQLNGADF